MTSKAFEHDNFVWLDFEAVHEILDKRIPGSSDAVIVFNNLLRWSLYQIDRTALDGVEEKRVPFWAALPFYWTHFTVCLPMQVLISLHNFYDWAIFGRCCNILALVEPQ